MNTITAEDTTPRIWVGCLAHYNAGRLVGEWFDAVDGDGSFPPAAPALITGIVFASLYLLMHIIIAIIVKVTRD